MLQDISQKRLLLYVLGLGLLPIIASLFWLYSSLNQLSSVEDNFSFLQYQAATKEKKQAQNLSVRQTFAESDHFYIDKHLETLTFLEPEVEALQKLLDGSLPVSESIRKRDDQLTSQNCLNFIEGQVRSLPEFQETEESLAHTVELNVSDVQKVLARVEGIEIGPFAPIATRPQLIITDFKIDKKEVMKDHEVFLLSLKLIKREFI